VLQDAKRKRRADKAELGANSWKAAAAKRNDSSKRQKFTDDGEVSNRYSSDGVAVSCE
jgi:hypothetical protein